MADFDHVLGGKPPATRFESKGSSSAEQFILPQPVKQIPVLEGLSDKEVRRQFMREGRPVVLRAKPPTGAAFKNGPWRG